MVDRQVRRRIQALEIQAVQGDREIAGLSGRLSRLAVAVDAVCTEAPRARVTTPARPRPLDSPAPVRPNPPTTKCAIPCAPPAFTSLIVADFPALFAEFRGKCFTLLWRGRRDGFGARDFHRSCDGHTNTLTLIEDTKGNIFGGFTPVEWESCNWYKADPSVKSFLFTLKNPHNFPARKFVLMAAWKGRAIYCHPSCGPYFWGIVVVDNCNANPQNHTRHFGQYYANSTGLPEKTFFTGSEDFIVKEIEVFEITD
jgi:hypothetical protein